MLDAENMDSRSRTRYLQIVVKSLRACILERLTIKWLYDAGYRAKQEGKFSRWPVASELLIAYCSLMGTIKRVAYLHVVSHFGGIVARYLEDNSKCPTTKLKVSSNTTAKIWQ